MPEPWSGRPEPLLSPLFLAGYIACITGAGALANCSLLAALYKSSRRGLFSIILQLAIADIALCVSISPEIWSFNTQNWVLVKSTCTVYRGLIVFASTASSYLVATLALHMLATANLEDKELTRRNRRADQDDEEEIRSSRHSLVASSDSSTPPRTMNLDYRISNASVPIMQPSIFVWVLSISLSVPDFTLATTVPLDQNTVTCTIVDSSQRIHLYTVLAILNLLLPLLLLCGTFTLVVMKLKSKSGQSASESKSSLKLSMYLIIVYIILCVPRSTYRAYGHYSTSLGVNATTFRYVDYESLGLAFSTTYLTSILIRPLLCIVMLQNVRKAFSSGLRDAANV